MADGRKTPAGRDEALIRAFLDGRNLSEIGEEFGISKSRVSRILTGHGLKPWVVFAASAAREAEERRSARRAEGIAARPTPKYAQHGTAQCYGMGRCRCVRCCAANTAACRAYRQQRRERA